MKIKALLAVVAMFMALVGTAAPAQAATYNSNYSELSFPAYTNNQFQVVLSGRIWPAAAGRPVSLYRNDAWAAGTHTDGNGRFSFTISVTQAAYFKFFSAKQVVGNHTYLNSSTGNYLVQPAPPNIIGSSYSELSFPGQTNIAGAVTMSGRIWPAAEGRAVSLQANGTWVAGTHTDANGRFSFTRSISSATSFSFYSARQSVGNNTYYERQSTGEYTVSPPSTESSMTVSKPAYTLSNQTLSLSGRVWPAAAGRSVSLYTDVAADGSGGTFTRSATTDANGIFVFSDVPIPQTTNVKVFSGPQNIGSLTYKGVGSGHWELRSLKFWDGFDGSVLDSGKWTTRSTSPSPAAGRSHMVGDPANAVVGGGLLNLTVTRPDPTGPWHTGFITTGRHFVMGDKFDAKIMFPATSGAQSAFWGQSDYTDPQDHEYDIIESWGSDGAPAQHQAIRNIDGTKFPVQATPNRIGGQWFTIEGRWASTGYRVRLTPQGGSPGAWTDIPTGGFVGQTPLALLLSQEVKDFQVNTDAQGNPVSLKKLPAGASLSDLTMKVDWVRVWR